MVAARSILEANYENARDHARFGLSRNFRRPHKFELLPLAVATARGLEPSTQRDLIPFSELSAREVDACVLLMAIIREGSSFVMNLVDDIVLFERAYAVTVDIRDKNLGGALDWSAKLIGCVEKWGMSRCSTATEEIQREYQRLIGRRPIVSTAQRKQRLELTTQGSIDSSNSRIGGSIPSGLYALSTDALSVENKTFFAAIDMTEPYRLRFLPEIYEGLVLMIFVTNDLENHRIIPARYDVELTDDYISVDRIGNFTELHDLEGNLASSVPVSVSETDVSRANFKHQMFGEYESIQGDPPKAALHYHLLMKLNLYEIESELGSGYLSFWISDDDIENGCFENTVMFTESD